MNKTILWFIVSCAMIVPSLKAVKEGEDEEEIVYAGLASFNVEEEPLEDEDAVFDNQEKQTKSQNQKRPPHKKKKKKKSSTLRGIFGKKSPKDEVEDGVSELWRKLFELDKLQRERNNTNQSLDELKDLMHKRQDIFKTLPQYEKHINFPNDQGETPLVVISERVSVDPKIFETLLKIGADPSAKNSDGKTARELLEKQIAKLQGISNLLFEAEQKQIMNCYY